MARWRFRYRVPLANDSQRQDFRAFAERFESEETELLGGFVARARALTREATNVTGRPMNATAFRRRAYIDPAPMRDFGVVTLSFRWTNFAEVRGERVVVGDVFEGGFYLGPGQRLVVRPGPGLVFRSVAPEAARSDPDSLRRSDSVTWTGERRFIDNRPRVVFAPVRAETGSSTPDPGTGAGGDGADSPDSGDDGGLLALVGVLFVGALLGAIALLVARRRGLSGFGAEPTDVEATSGTGAPGDGSGPPATIATGAAPGDSAADAPEAAGTSESETADAAVSGPDLQSDKDRVIAMLEANDGRMRQSRIVEETGWSKSKVSMLLSEMEEDDRVSKLRLGRENVVSLPDADPTEGG